MAISKKDRQAVFDMYGGRCAYCGCELVKGWCVDHIEPIQRKMKRIGGYKHRVTGEYANNTTNAQSLLEEYEYVPYRNVPDGCDNPEKDVIENMAPSCFSCNSYKHSMSLETFRKQVGLLVERLNKSFTQYKIAKRFGLIEEKQNPVVFYFETLLTEIN